MKGPSYPRSKTPPAGWSSMLATRIEATQTRVSDAFGSSSVSSRTARSFLQKSFSTRFSAMGFTFQVSPVR
ncbi:MAG TPA: hypothetical protein VH062_32525 [Polyangiaceae bacterium]|nr:hypothetical protein [Polyangiaceae bacterium]